MIHRWKFLYTYRIRSMLVLFIMFSCNSQSISCGLFDLTEADFKNINANPDTISTKKGADKQKVDIRLASDKKSIEILNSSIFAPKIAILKKEIEERKIKWLQRKKLLLEQKKKLDQSLKPIIKLIADKDQGEQLDALIAGMVEQWEFQWKIVLGLEQEVELQQQHLDDLQQKIDLYLEYGAFEPKGRFWFYPSLVNIKSSIPQINYEYQKLSPKADEDGIVTIPVLHLVKKWYPKKVDNDNGINHLWRSRIMETIKITLSNGEIGNIDELKNSPDVFEVGSNYVIFKIERNQDGSITVEAANGSISMTAEPECYYFTFFLIGFLCIRSKVPKLVSIHNSNTNSKSQTRIRIDKILQQIDKKAEDPVHRTTLILLSSQYAELKHEWLTKKIKRENYLIEKNQIRSSVIQLYSDVFDKLPNHIN